MYGQTQFGNVLFGGVPYSGTCIFDSSAFDYLSFSTCNYQEKVPLKTSLIDYIRRKLGDNVYFSDQAILTEIGRAENDITQKKKFIYYRFSLELKKGVGLYNLPLFVDNVVSITYKGIPINFNSMSELQEVSTYRSVSSKPLYASLQFEGNLVLRIFPVPSEDLAADDSIVNTGAGIKSLFIISCNIGIDESNENISVPPWIARVMIRFFVLSKLLKKEGPHQNFNLAQYYESKYSSYVNMFSMLIERTYAAKIKQIGGPITSYKKARPVLPPNFER
jgi:hypothetical protein